MKNTFIVCFAPVKLQNVFVSYRKTKKHLYTVKAVLLILSIKLVSYLGFSMNGEFYLLYTYTYNRILTVFKRENGHLLDI